MQIIKAFLCALGCVIFSVWACAEEVPIFWKIEKDNKIFYALGTLHQGPRLEQMSPKIHAALKEAKYLFTEKGLLDLLKDQSHSSLAQALEGIEDQGIRVFQNDDNGLSENLSVSEVEKILRITGQERSKICRTRLPFLIEWLDAIINSERSGRIQALDTQIKGLATNNSIRVVDIETTEGVVGYVQQMLEALEDGVSKKDLAKNIQNLININLEESKAKHGEVVAKYERGYYELDLTNARTGFFQHLMLFPRNRWWFPTLLTVFESLQKGESAFLAAGLAHPVVGTEDPDKKSLFQMFEEKGFKISPILENKLET